MNNAPLAHGTLTGYNAPPTSERPSPPAHGSAPELDSTERPENSESGGGVGGEETKALLKDRYGPKVRPIAYVCHVPRLTALAREYGYAITIHGSLQSDLDLVAVPWSIVAVDALTLVKAVCEIVGGFILEGQWEPTTKPHGRRAWTIHLGAGLWIDLSVMPRESEWSERLKHHEVYAAVEAILAPLVNESKRRGIEEKCAPVEVARDALMHLFRTAGAAVGDSASSAEQTQAQNGRHELPPTTGSKPGETASGG